MAEKNKSLGLHKYLEKLARFPWLGTEEREGRSREEKRREEGERESVGVIT